MTVAAPRRSSASATSLACAQEVFARKTRTAPRIRSAMFPDAGQLAVPVSGYLSPRTARAPHPCAGVTARPIRAPAWQTCVPSPFCTTAPASGTAFGDPACLQAFVYHVAYDAYGSTSNRGQLLHFAWGVQRASTRAGLSVCGSTFRSASGASGTARLVRDGQCSYNTRHVRVGP